MKQQVLELVSFKLAPGSSEAEMLAASGMCQSEFLQKQEGFLLRLTARRDDGALIATGVRVLGISATGKTLREARDAAYAAVDRLDWPGGFCRRDIGWRALT